jgi:hypothetical protein
MTMSSAAPHNRGGRRSRPTLETLFLICDALGISAADLVGRVERARKKPR